MLFAFSLPNAADENNCLLIWPDLYIEICWTVYVGADIYKLVGQY